MAIRSKGTQLIVARDEHCADPVESGHDASADLKHHSTGPEQFEDLNRGSIKPREDVVDIERTDQIGMSDPSENRWQEPPGMPGRDSRPSDPLERQNQVELMDGLDEHDRCWRDSGRDQSELSEHWPPGGESADAVRSSELSDGNGDAEFVASQSRLVRRTRRYPWRLLRR